MRMYLTSNGTYFATQDEARKAAKEFGSTFEGIDVPVKLRELVGYLNTHMKYPVAAAAPAAPVGGNGEAPPARPSPAEGSYTDWSVAVDDNWETLPLARKLHFAALAMETAREQIPNAVEAPRPAARPADDLL